MNTEKQIQLSIKLDSHHINYTQPVHGTLHVRCTHPLNLETIYLTLTKSLETTYKDPDIERNSKKEIYKYDFDIFSAYPREDIVKNLTSALYTRLSSGHHTFPFQFYLKPSDNASTNLVHMFSNTLIKIKNTYVLEANLRVNGVYMPVVTTRKEILVADVVPSNYDEVFDVELTTWFCFIKNYVNVVVNFDKDFYYSGDEVLVKINRRICAVDVVLYQFLTIYVDQSSDLGSDNSLNGNSDISTNSELYNGNLVLKTKSRLINRKKQLNTDTVSIQIPQETPSSASEVFFDVKYQVGLVIYFGKSHVQMNREIIIIKKNPFVKPEPELDVLSGTKNITKFFTLE